MELDPTVTTLVMCYRGERRLRDVLADMAVALRLELDQLVPGGARRRARARGKRLPPAELRALSLIQPRGDRLGGVAPG
jgi:hypothetical protein